MSGPKCNNYELSEERKREEMRRLREEAKKRIKEEIRKKEEERRKKEEERKKREEEAKRQAEEERRREEKEREERAAFCDELNAEVEAQIAQLTEFLYKKREQEIIAETIGEAMEELGYDLIASTGAAAEDEVPVQAQVFSFSDGVGIQMIENGERISMEVVGIGTNNRRPTEEEAAYLEHQMEEFCNAYEKLDEVLKAKGIVKAATIRRLPPDKKYARILNMEQFTSSPNEKVSTLQTVMKSRQQNTSAGTTSIQKKTKEKRING